MTIQEMHYDLKSKFNKVDSQKNRNLLIPEIDWVLNEAQEIFKKIVAFPRYRTLLGFETSTRNTESIRTVVKTENVAVVANTVDLPPDYQYYVRGRVTMTKGDCTAKGVLHIAEHDDLNDVSPFHSTSFLWREVYGLFEGNSIKLLEESGTTVQTVQLTYINTTPYMHFASGFSVTGYVMPGETTPLTGTQDCLLPAHTHREIVDIAVAILAGNIQTSDFNIRMNKLSFNQLM